MSPIERFEAALAAQVPEGVSASRWRAFPPPVGAWLAKGSPGKVRALMREYGVSPAGLLHAWVLRWPVSLKVETWTRKKLEERYKSWGVEARRVYTRQRKALVDVLTVKGKLSEEVRLVCARFGAWCALGYLEAEGMPMSWLVWAGVGVEVEGGSPGAFWLQSDNYRGEVPEGLAVYRASELEMIYREPVETVGVVVELKRAFPGAVVTSVGDGAVEADGFNFREGKWVDSRLAV